MEDGKLCQKSEDRIAFGKPCASAKASAARGWRTKGAMLRLTKWLFYCSLKPHNEVLIPNPGKRYHQGKKNNFFHDVLVSD